MDILNLLGRILVKNVTLHVKPVLVKRKINVNNVIKILIEHYLLLVVKHAIQTLDIMKIRKEMLVNVTPHVKHAKRLVKPNVLHVMMKGITQKKTPNKEQVNVYQNLVIIKTLMKLNRHFYVILPVKHVVDGVHLDVMMIVQKEELKKITI